MTGVRLSAIPQNLSLTTLATGDVTLGTSTVPSMITVSGDSSHYGAIYFSGWRNAGGASSVNLILNNSGGTLVAVGTDQANGALAFGTTAGSSSGTNFTTIYAELTQTGNWTLSNAAQLGFTSSGTASGAADTILTRAAPASLRLGATDVDTAPVAQTLRTQGALAGGTSDVAGANWTFIASPGKGTGIGGSLIFQTAPAGSTGTVVNAPATVLTLSSTKLATFAGAISAVGSLTFTTNTAGIVLKQGANGLCGTFVANGATPVVVNNSNIAITDSIIISLNTIGGTVGVQPHVSAITGSTSFAVTCTAVDTSTYNYAIIKNAA